MKGLSPRQREALAIIRASIAKGYPPTHREIGAALGVSCHAASLHIMALERKGFIEVDHDKSRGIRLCAVRPEWPALLKTREGHTLMLRSERAN